jgi:hypothetical protein
MLKTRTKTRVEASGAWFIDADLMELVGTVE